MHKVLAKSKNLLWLCTARKRIGCNGQIRYEEYLERVDPATTLGHFLPKLGTLLLPEASQEKPKEPARTEPPQQLRDHWIAITRRAFELIGNERQVMFWLEQPKVALGFKAPFEMMMSLEGCMAVAQLLENLWN